MSLVRACCCDDEKPQACCLPDGTCIDVLPSECLAMGGAPQGEGTTCATTTCPSPGDSCDDRYGPGGPFLNCLDNIAQLCASSYTVAFSSEFRVAFNHGAVLKVEVAEFVVTQTAGNPCIYEVTSSNVQGLELDPGTGGCPGSAFDNQGNLTFELNTLICDSEFPGRWIVGFQGGAPGDGFLLGGAVWRRSVNSLCPPGNYFFKEFQSIGGGGEWSQLCTGAIPQIE